MDVGEALNIRFLQDCHCAARQVAQREDKFFYATAHSAYIFHDSEGIPRWKSGKHVTWVTCPFCGGSIIDRGELGW